MTKGNYSIVENTFKRTWPGPRWHEYDLLDLCIIEILVEKEKPDVVLKRVDCQHPLLPREETFSFA